MRTIISILAALAALALPATGLAAPSSGPATGEIWVGLGFTGCALAARTADGTPVNAFGVADGTPTVKFLRGTSFADLDVGWVCEGQTVYTGLPEGATPLVLTGLTCKVIWEGPLQPPTPITGVLASSGTAILYRDGTARLICPPSRRQLTYIG